MKLLKKISAVVVTAVLSASLTMGALLPLSVNAASSLNTGSHNYKGYSQYWDGAGYTSMYRTSDGYMVVIGNNSAIVAMYYDINYNYKSCKQISIDYDEWGGSYSDGTYYYLFTGKKNSSHSNSAECYRLTKFDANWNKLGQVGVSNCNTAVPFDASNVDFVHSGSNLYIRCGCEMYSGHQANITFQFNTASMTLVGFTNYDSMGKGYDNNGYTSHTFHTEIAIDGSNLIAADHGDAYPRSMSVTKCSPNVSTGTFYSDYWSGQSTRYTVFNIGGNYNSAGNQTNAKLGGLAVSSTSYLTVGTSIDQNNFNSNSTQNVYIGVINKNTGASSVKWLTSLSGGPANNPTNPYIVKINDDRFAVLWSDSSNTTVYYAYINANGDLIDSIGSMSGSLSDCQPIVNGIKITWYASSSQITVNGGSVSNPGGRFYSIFVDPAAQREIIGEFVDRLYSTCLNRKPDASGRNTWIELLFSGSRTGSEVAYGFVFSAEFMGLNLCNDCYVDRLYEAFMGRSSDPQGKSTWVNLLNSGASREYVFNGFALSAEFTRLCNDYGIVLGNGIPVPTKSTIPTSTCSQCNKQFVINDGIVGFVTRLYTVALGRNPDDSYTTWLNGLASHSMTGSEVAYGFIFSAEYQNKNLTNEQYVDSLYATLFDRPGDPAGRQMWIDMLNSGYSREDIFWGFIGSQECTNLCNRFNIIK